MKKLVVVLAISTIILGIVSGLLFYQLTSIQSLNSDLGSQNIEIQNQLDDIQINNSELQNQISELEDQISRVTNRVNITEFKVYG